MLKLKSSGELYEQYVTAMNRIADLRFAGAVLQWDQETYLPPKGAALRGQQIATLSELAHEYFTRKDFGELLKELEQRTDLTELQRSNVQLSAYDYSRQEKFSASFVRKLTEAVNTAFHSWINARKENNFSLFSIPLETLTTLKRQEAELAGYAHHPYDALLNEFDKGSTVALLDEVFGQIIPPLNDIVQQIQQRPQPDDQILKKFYPKDQQWAMGMRILGELGFDFEAGRQDISAHPFTTNFNRNDVRITTRIDEYDLGNMLWSCIHELGHALYEQGLPEEQYGLPLGEYASLSIHESQSRLWVNHIGRSNAFIDHYFPVMKTYFPEQLGDTDAETFYRAVNKVTPSMIRTEADEVTYHFHVYIRYTLEKALIGNQLEVRDIPAFWNEQYFKLLNQVIPNDNSGCLQDVHWSHGSFGYFPTYSQGSFYAAQFYAAATEQRPEIGQGLPGPDNTTLLSWLRQEIHAHGRKFESEALCRRVSGEPLRQSYFLKYIREKYGNLYGLKF